MSAERIEAITFEVLPIKAAREEYPHLWETVTQHFPWMTPKQRAEIISMIVNICSACHAAPSTCRCWQDD